MILQNETQWSTADLETFIHKAWPLVPTEDQNCRLDGNKDMVLVAKHWCGAQQTVVVKRTRTPGLWELKLPQPKKVLDNAIERLASVGNDEGPNGMPSKWKVELAYACIRLIWGRSCDIRYKHRTHRSDEHWEGEWGAKLPMRALPKKLGKGTDAAALRLNLAISEYQRTQKNYDEALKEREVEIEGLRLKLEALQNKAKTPKKRKKKSA